MLNRKSVSEQVADYLRDDLLKRRWTTYLPGRDMLAKELGVHGSTTERALELLEKEGLLQSRGAGKRRLITVPDHLKQRGMHVVIVLYEREDTLNNYILDLQYRLYAAGHTFTFAPQTMRELGFDPKKIETMIKNHPAEAYHASDGLNFACDVKEASPERRCGHPMSSTVGLGRRHSPFAEATEDRCRAIATCFFGNSR